MEIERAREDLLVAVTAAGTTVALALLARVGVVPTVGVWGALSPVFVYFGYLFSRKSGPYGAWDTARNWSIVAVLVGIVAVGVAAL